MVPEDIRDDYGRVDCLSVLLIRRRGSDHGLDNVG